MAIRILKEVSRDGGRLPATNAVILGGSVLELASNGANVQLSTSTGSTLPWGLSSDSNVTQPLQGAGGLTVGVGFDYTNFNRGGLIGAFQNGGVFELYNDGTGNPFVLSPTAPYAVNIPLYALTGNGTTTGGTVTSDSAGNSPAIGSCVSVTNAGSSTTMRLQIKLSI